MLQNVAFYCHSCCSNIYMHIICHKDKYSVALRVDCICFWLRVCVQYVYVYACVVYICWHIMSIINFLNHHFSWIQINFACGNQFVSYTHTYIYSFTEFMSKQVAHCNVTMPPVFRLYLVAILLILYVLFEYGNDTNYLEIS